MGISPRYRWVAGWLVALVLVGATVWGVWALMQMQPLQKHQFEGQAMNARYQLTMVDWPANVYVGNIDYYIQQSLSQVEQRISTQNGSSDVWVFNSSTSTDWMTIQPETAQVIELAMDVGRRSGGAYDITARALVGLWGFERATGPTPPTPGQIATARQNVGMDFLSVQPENAMIRKSQPGVKIDLTGVAKGHAADRAAEMIEELGITNYRVEVHHRVRARGHNDRRKPWRVAITAPALDPHAPAALRFMPSAKPIPKDPPPGPAQRVVEMSAGGLASARVGRVGTVKGQPICDVIDPRTGSPITHALASVTVIDVTCARADAWATALLILGPEKGYELAVKENLRAFFIIRDGEKLVEKETPRWTAEVRSSRGQIAKDEE